jgi:hypothetical protein
MSSADARENCMASPARSKMGVSVSEIKGLNALIPIWRQPVGEGFANKTNCRTAVTNAPAGTSAVNVDVRGISHSCGNSPI